MLIRSSDDCDYEVATAASIGAAVGMTVSRRRPCPSPFAMADGRRVEDGEVERLREERPTGETERASHGGREQMS